ncbi:unnamed protein product, partial [Notodromas monacha]
ERLVVDAALALKSKGHLVRFVTNHHDRSHCFPETRDGTVGVTVVGEWFPRSVLGKCQALCAYLRMMLAAFYLVWFSGIKCDVIFVDQISVCIPILRMGTRAKIVFYCHFPDQLLSAGRENLIKSLYRAPLDFLEEVTTGMAHKILVNSQFTGKILPHDSYYSNQRLIRKFDFVVARVFEQTFKRISKKPEVLCPSINTDKFDE